MAALIVVDRVMIGLHYPGDILGGALIGVGAAWIMHRFAQGPLTRLAGWISALTDPLVRSIWAAIDRQRRGAPHPG